MWTSTVRSSMKTWSPHTLSSSCERENTRSGWPTRKPKQLELGQAHFHRLAFDPHFVARRIDRQRTIVGRFAAVLRRAAPEHGADARDQLARRKWLYHVVVGAGVETHDPVGLAALGGQHDDRHGSGCDRPSAGPSAGRCRACRAASSRAARGQATAARSPRVPRSPNPRAAPRSRSCCRCRRPVPGSPVRPRRRVSMQSPARLPARHGALDFVGRQVPRIDAARDEDHVLGDVLRVVADALDRLGRPDRIE